MQPQFFSITIDWFKVRTRWSNKLLKRGFIILRGDRQLCFRGLPKSIRVDRRQKSWRIIQQRECFYETPCYNARKRRFFHCCFHKKYIFLSINRQHRR